MAWAKADMSVMTNTSLSPWARLLVVMLAHHNHKERGCFPKRDVLAAELGCSVPTIDRAMRDLVRVGVVTSTRQGRGHSNRYTLVDDLSPLTTHVPDGLSPVTSHPEHESSPVMTLESSPVMTHDDRLLITEQEPIEQEPDVRTPVVPTPIPASRPDDGFATFWAIYPRTNGSRANALTAWKRLAPSPELQAEIVAGLERWIASDHWREGFVKYAERFLRDRMWEDTPAPKARSPALNGYHKPTHMDRARAFAEKARLLEAEGR